MDNFKRKLAQYMAGRYGIDKLYYVLTGAIFVLIIINSFAKSSVLSILTSAVLVWMFYRVMSRNFVKRRKENDFFFGIVNNFKKKILLQVRRFKERKTHIYRTCPKCKKTLRLPRKKGSHEVECPLCHNTFNVKVRL